MASIQKRNDNKYYVVYSIKNPETGKYDTPWIPFDNEDEAISYKEQVEKELLAVKQSRKDKHSISNPTRTVEQLIWHYVELVGKNKWGVKTYPNQIARINNYIIPHIGKWRVWECTALKMDGYFAMLKTQDAVQQKGKGTKKISAKIVNEVHKFLKACFRKAVRWGMMDINPCAERNSTLPDYKAKKVVCWSREEFIEGVAIAECLPDITLAAALHIAVSTTLREGEICGLQLDDVFVSDEDIATGDCRVVVTKELERVNKDAMKELDNKDIIRVFPDVLGNAKSSLVLKKTKTDGSQRTVYIPSTAAKVVQRLLAQIAEMKEFHGSSYKGYGLLMTPGDGRPLEPSKLNNRLQALIKRSCLKKVTFHSLRHTSVSYKLKASNGDIKAVMVDSGHQTAQMVTEQYAETFACDQKVNAVNLDKLFYGADISSGAAQTDGRMNPSPQAIIEIVQMLQANPQILTTLSAVIDSGQLSLSDPELMRGVVLDSIECAAQPTR